jgi:hypothetical protein
MYLNMLMSGVIPMPAATKTKSSSFERKTWENRPNGPWTAARSPGLIRPMVDVKSPLSLIVKLIRPPGEGLDAIENGCSSAKTELR